jgi:hypothetical protein
VPRHKACYCYYQKTWQVADKEEKRFACPPKEIRVAKKTIIHPKNIARPEKTLADP